jgi:MAPEG family
MDLIQALSLESEPFRWLVRCSLVLVVKMLLSNVYVGIVKLRHRSYTSPEDRRFFVGGPPVDVKTRFAPKHHPAVDRAYAVVRNDQENIYPFLFVALLYVLCGAPTWYSKVRCR